MGLRDRLRKRSPEDAFAEEITTLVRQALPVRTVAPVDNFSLSITFADGQTTTMFLGTIFAEASRLDGQGRAERLRRAVLAMAPAERPSAWADAAGLLRPALRAMSWAAAGGGGDAQPSWKPFAPFIVSLTAIDAEHGMSFVTYSDIDRWKVDRVTIEKTAHDNLVRSGVAVVRVGNDPWMDVAGPDGYISSWLLCPDALEHLGDALGGHFVALAPSRDELRLVATSDRAALLAQLETLLEAYQAAPRQLSPVPYELSGGRFVPWVPPPGDPCRLVVDRANAFLAAVEYGQQHDALEELFERTGHDIFVAQFNLIERPDTTVWSWAAWVKQVTAGLLPRADYVALGDTEEGTSFWVRWEDAERLAPKGLRLDPDYHPPRWQTSGWPDDGELTCLRAVAIDIGGE